MHESRTDNSPTGSATPFDPSSISRPDPLLLKYYFIVAVCTVFGFPFALLAFYIKYNTLRYSFDDKGVSMSHGWLFKREVYLTYRRIQDIHVSRNIIHRWLGLSAVAIQTASGSSSAEMTIEGITNPEGLRDFLYMKMRGARDGIDPTTLQASQHAPASSGGDEALALLHEIRDELRALRESRAADR